MFSRSDLDESAAMDARPAVSIYLPTHIAGREIRQDPIRLKNLLSSAADRLAATWRRPEIEDFLGPAESLVGDEEFWRHQQQGLAAFLAPGFNRIHKLPIPVPEESFLGDHFHIKTLLPLLEDAGCSRSAPTTPASTTGPGGNFPRTRGSICRRASARYAG
jgi:hypothetical protein